MKRKMTAGLVAVVAITAIVISSGYAGADEQLTPEEIIDMVLANATAIDTYSFDIDQIATSVLLTNETGKVDTLVLRVGNGVLDNMNQELAMQDHITTRITDKEGLLETTVGQRFNTYLVNNTLYMQTRIPGESSNWTKMELPEMDIYWEINDQLNLQLQYLNDSEVVGLEDAVVDGVDCYVLNLTYHDSLMNMSLMATVWIEKDTMFLVMAQETITMDLSPEDVGSSKTEEEFSLTSDSEIVLQFYDYNKPVSIELPAAAENATELSLP